MQLGPISKSQFEHIVTEMDAYGYAALPDVFSTAEIAEARRFVEDEVARHQGQYFSFVGREPVTGTFFERIGDLSWFCDLLADLSA